NSLPACTSQSCTMLSPPEAIVFPSGEKAMALIILCSGPLNCRSSLPVEVSNRRRVWSAPQNQASVLLSGENASREQPHGSPLNKGRISSPVVGFRKQSKPSSPAEARNSPSGEKARERTPFVCARTRRNSFQLAVSQKPITPF